MPMHPLTAYCERHDLRLDRLAKRLRRSSSTLSRLVRAERRPSPELMLDIQNATEGEVTVTQLIEFHFAPRTNASAVGGAPEADKEDISGPGGSEDVAIPSAHASQAAA